MKSVKNDDNKAAERYGYARIGLSTPDGNWTFVNDGVVNDQTPMPCSDSDSKDIPYVKTVFNFIESNPDKFDASKIWVEGFSQNSVFSAYIGFCFSNKVLGVWQEAGGMALNGHKPDWPRLEAQCTVSSFDQFGKKCKEKQPCTECKYWPIYPCYQPKRAVIDCVVDYTNDYLASYSKNPDVDSTSLYMYDKLVNEGHDARLLRFSPSKDGTIKGGHENLQNKVFWQIGCLGITSPCTDQCAEAFVKCVASQDVSTAKKRVVAFKSCIDKDLQGCTKTCSPTLKMLKESEEPTVIKGTADTDNFGTANKKQARPKSSLCQA